MFIHKPVLLQQVLALLAEGLEEAVFVDATLGERSKVKARWTVSKLLHIYFTNL